MLKALLRNKLDKTGKVILCDNKAKNVDIAVRVPLKALAEAQAIARLFNAVSVQKNKPEWVSYFLTMPNIFLSILILCLSLDMYSQDNVQWRGEGRDGIYNETGLLEKWPENGPKMLWHFDGLGDGHASAAVTGNKIFTSGTLEGQGYVFAFDHNGNLLWKSEIGKSWTDNWNGVRSTPMLHEGKIYIMSAYGKLVCMNPDNGQTVWSIDLIEKYNGRNIRWGVTENLLIDDNKLFITLGGTENNVIALDP
ncbi:MAG: PQQ-binding-like beta-propeller repeat protein, partial [Bacteroidales bacterium]|nr:PQQ-binding-like beta-propeller repeat protein [Bacteroidales bacterium]